jgi:hypothetical protein
MAEEAGGYKIDETKLKTEAIEEIVRCIDNAVALKEKLFFYELYSHTFLRSNIPDWYLNKNYPGYLSALR